MILDATAGNRIMWSVKQSNHIIYIDKQLRLEVPPTMFSDNTQTPFRDDLFDTIFYDPPHSWNDKAGYYSHPNIAEYKQHYKSGDRIPTYYGLEIFDRREQLIRHIYNAQREFYRITKEDGFLWFKWCEVNIPLDNILTVMTDWQTLMKLYINSPDQRSEGLQTYWLCMQKRKGVSQTLLFGAIPASYDSSVHAFNPSKPKQSIT